MTAARGMHGFTLVEVLIALALVATTLGGTLAIVRGAVANHDYLERRLYAAWVADNVAASYRLEPARFDPRNRQGEEQVLGRRFAWALEIEDIDPGEEDTTWERRARIIVEVTDDTANQPLAQREMVVTPGGAGS